MMPDLSLLDSEFATGAKGVVEKLHNSLMFLVCVIKPYIAIYVYVYMYIYILLLFYYYYYIHIVCIVSPFNYSTHFGQHFLAFRGAP